MDNTLRKAAEMALEYLEYLNELDIAGLDHEVHTNALRQALAQPKYRRGDRLLCLENEEYCVIHISGTDRQWVKFPDSQIAVYTNEQVQELFELIPKETDEAIAQSEKKQTHNLVHEIDLVLTDPESDLSEGAKRALRYVGKQLQGQPEQTCCCGEPDALGVIHRKDNPCYIAQPEQEPVKKALRLKPHECICGYSVGHPLVPKCICKPEYTAPPKPEQEPVAKVVLTEIIGLPLLHWLDLDRQFDFKGGEFLYTAPPKQWVGLTDEEIENCFDESCYLKQVDQKYGIKGTLKIHDVARAIEAKLREKNG